MLYDRRDFGLLRLAGTYQWLPLAPLRALSSLKHLYREAELLSTLGLLSFSRSNQYLMPSPEGYQFLASMEIDCHAPTKRPYAQSSALRRRLEVGTVLLTCLGAGIEPAYDKVDRLKRQPVFLPAFRGQFCEKVQLYLLYGKRFAGGQSPHCLYCPGRGLRPLGKPRLSPPICQPAKSRLFYEQ